ncbi:DNA topoisomerase [Algoriphagus sanaruensis]|uniref:DNA topoisomerase n=1 Tax=Algoriphagus sanaruensis TaxID=1727163 RepID=A0A142EI30_9BACT|nr:DNA topoisomerase [Algoriphagus sanaruensis]
MVVNIDVSSLASLRQGLTRSAGNRFDSNMSSNQNTDSSASSWTKDNFEINSARERPRCEDL